MAILDTVQNVARVRSLTAREAGVLSEVGKGKSNAEVAAALGITEKTVKNTLGPIALKLGVERGGSMRVRLARVALGFPPSAE